MTLRFAYADPPYIGCAHLYPEHPESSRWDDPDEHIDLMGQLNHVYDGWALSCHAPPEAFCRWVLMLLGWQDGDEMVDVFPGTGVMGRVASENRLAL